MDINNFGDYYNRLIDSSIFINVRDKTKKQDDFIADVDNLSDKLINSPNISRAATTNMSKNVGENKLCATVQRYDISETSTEPYCHVKLDSIIKLKDSTKKLLCLLEEIKSKSRSQHPACAFPRNSDSELNGKSLPSTDIINLVTDISATALKPLEIQTEILDTIPLMNEDDDCSIFKKLTRKCICLNQQEYNDFVIHFNESSNYYTSITGEVIKNLRILKRFLYMGGDYAKHALMFLDQGLEESSYAEKVEIIQGCAHADMCNVFDDVSIVITCIAWPYKYDSYGDTVTQELAAEFVNKLAQLEEGRRYLKFTSKITNDIKKVLKKKGAKLQIKTLESLYATLDQLHPKLEMAANATDKFYCRHADEGFGIQTMQALIYYRQYMTLGEIFTHLDLLNKWSMNEKGKTELKKCQKLLLELFKDMLLQYNDSELNVIVADILNNLISKSMLEKKKSIAPKIMIIADASTEPIQMQDKCCQNSKKKITMKRNTTRTRRQSVYELKISRKAFNVNGYL